MSDNLNRAGKVAIVAAIWLSLSACIFTQAALSGGIVTDSPVPRGMVQSTYTPPPPTQAATTPPPKSACVVSHTSGLALNVRACQSLACPVLYGLMPGKTINLSGITPGDTWYQLESGGYIYFEFCEVIP